MHKRFVKVKKKRRAKSRARKNKIFWLAIAAASKYYYMHCSLIR